jgi:hypothetical protein
MPPRAIWNFPRRSIRSRAPALIEIQRERTISRSRIVEG